MLDPKRLAKSAFLPLDLSTFVRIVAELLFRHLYLDYLWRHDVKIPSELYLYWYAPYDDMHVRVYLVYNYVRFQS